jgi:8-oxo-dGTP pyrophosphatase MutT (NUDIX family)
MKPKRFVLTFLFDPTFTKVVLIRKNKPDWMAGKLNAVGGHVEEGEEFHDAAVREFVEETGLTIEIWQPFMRLFRPGDTEDTLRTLECYWAVSENLGKVKSTTDELVGVFDVQSVLGRDDIVKDTKWILAAGQEAAQRWTNEGKEFYFEVHDKDTGTEWQKLM